MAEKQVLYLVDRSVNVIKDPFEEIKKEFIQLWTPLRAALKTKMDAEETYVVDDAYVKRLDPDCEPYRELSYSIALEENDCDVGYVLLRATNVPHKTRIDMYNDCLERTYELRFKTFGGAAVTIESSGISISQTNDGYLRINSGSISFWHCDVLRKNFDKFKAQISDVINHPKMEVKYSKAKQYWQSKPGV